MDEDALPLTTGTATPASGLQDMDDYPVATIWLPDPGARRGWLTHPVWRKEPPKQRTTGFRIHKR